MFLRTALVCGFRNLVA